MPSTLYALGLTIPSTPLIIAPLHYTGSLLCHYSIVQQQHPYSEQTTTTTTKLELSNIRMTVDNGDDPAGTVQDYDEEEIEEIDVDDDGDNPEVLEEFDEEEEIFEEEIWEETVEEYLEDGDDDYDDLLASLQASFRELVNRPASIAPSLDQIEEEEVEIIEDTTNHNNDTMIPQSTHHTVQSENTGVLSTDNSASVDFDLGDFNDMDEDDDESEPEDYEAACRELVPIVYHNVVHDVEDLIRHCDPPNLYKNLRQQYRHMVHNHEIEPLKNKKDNNSSDDNDDDAPQPDEWEDFEGSNTIFTGGPFAAADTTRTGTSSSDPDGSRDSGTGSGSDEWGFDNITSSNDAWEAANKLPNAITDTGGKKDFPKPMDDQQDNDDGFLFKNAMPVEDDEDDDEVEDEDDDQENSSRDSYSKQDLTEMESSDAQFKQRNALPGVEGEDDFDVDQPVDSMDPLFQHKNAMPIEDEEDSDYRDEEDFDDQQEQYMDPHFHKNAMPIEEDLYNEEDDPEHQSTPISSYQFKNAIPIESGDDQQVDTDARGSDFEEDKRQIERWLDRDADAPKDLEVAIRRMIPVIYGDEEVDMERLMRRMSLPDLYKYLKQYYWYKVHNSQVTENAVEEVLVAQSQGSVQNALASRLARRLQVNQQAATPTAAVIPSAQAKGDVVSRGQQMLEVESALAAHQALAVVVKDDSNQQSLRQQFETARILEDQTQLAAEEARRAKEILDRLEAENELLLLEEARLAERSDDAMSQASFEEEVRAMRRDDVNASVETHDAMAPLSSDSGSHEGRNDEGWGSSLEDAGFTPSRVAYIRASSGSSGFGSEQGTDSNGGSSLHSGSRDSQNWVDATEISADGGNQSREGLLEDDSSSSASDLSAPEHSGAFPVGNPTSHTRHTSADFHLGPADSEEPPSVAVASETKRVVAAHTNVDEVGVKETADTKEKDGDKDSAVPEEDDYNQEIELRSEYPGHNTSLPTTLTPDAEETTAEYDHVADSFDDDIVVLEDGDGIAVSEGEAQYVDSKLSDFDSLNRSNDRDVDAVFGADVERNIDSMPGEFDVENVELVAEDTTAEYDHVADSFDDHMGVLGDGDGIAVSEGEAQYVDSKLSDVDSLNRSNDRDADAMFGSDGERRRDSVPREFDVENMEVVAENTTAEYDQAADSFDDDIGVLGDGVGFAVAEGEVRSVNSKLSDDDSLNRSDDRDTDAMFGTDGERDKDNVPGEFDVENMELVGSGRQGAKEKATFVGSSLVPRFYGDGETRMSTPTESSIETFVTAQQELITWQTPKNRGFPLADSFDDPIAVDSSQDGISNDNMPTATIQETVDVHLQFTQEGERLKEMAEILEFKRRVDMARLSEETKSLEQRRQQARTDLANEARRLQEQRRIDKEKLEEEARLLEEKRCAEEKVLDQDAVTLKLWKSTEEKRLNTESRPLKENGSVALKMLKQSINDLEEKRRGEDASFSLKLQHLQEKLNASRARVEAERAKFDEVLKIEEAREAELRKEGGGFFGVFGARKKTPADLEIEKEKQQRLMKQKMKEMELEDQAMVIERDYDQVAEEGRQMEEAHHAELVHFNKQYRELEDSIFSTTKELAAEARRLEETSHAEELRIETRKQMLAEIRLEDEAWLTQEKAAFELKWRIAEARLSEETEARIEAQRALEDNNKKAAIGLKKRWARDQASLNEELRRFEETRSAYLATYTQATKTSNEKDIRKTSTARVSDAVPSRIVQDRDQTMLKAADIRPVDASRVDTEPKSTSDPKSIESTNEIFQRGDFDQLMTVNQPRIIEELDKHPAKEVGTDALANVEEIPGGSGSEQVREASKDDHSNYDFIRESERALKVNEGEPSESQPDDDTEAREYGSDFLVRYEMESPPATKAEKARGAEAKIETRMVYESHALVGRELSGMRDGDLNVDEGRLDSEQLLERHEKGELNESVVEEVPPDLGLRKEVRVVAGENMESEDPIKSDETMPISEKKKDFFQDDLSNRESAREVKADEYDEKTATHESQIGRSEAQSTAEKSASAHDNDSDELIDIEAERREELAKRKAMVDKELNVLVAEAENEELEEQIEPEVLVALKQAAMKICFTKKYYDVFKDDFIYFPTVTASFLDYTLTEEADKYYFDDVDEIPVENCLALRGWIFIIQR
jgi:hypothetical protein